MFGGGLGGGIEIIPFSPLSGGWLNGTLAWSGSCTGSATRCILDCQGQENMQTEERCLNLNMMKPMIPNLAFHLTTSSDVVFVFSVQSLQGNNINVD